MSAIAVIGAGGFVGARLIEAMLLDGRTDVRAIVRNYRNMAALCRFGTAVDVRRADAEIVDSLTAALQGSTTAVNVTTGPPAGIERSTIAIYEACVRANVSRLVHLSSAVVYGDVLQRLGDDDPPVSKHWMPYARAKGAAELWLRGKVQNAAPEIVVLRPGIVWGVRSPHTHGFARALASKSTFLVGDGSGVFNGIYIDNLVDAIRVAASHASPAGGFYNVGDKETVTWREFFEAIGPSLGCDPARLVRVDAEHFPWSVGALVDTAQSLPYVNELYHRLKVHVPASLKANIRARLDGVYDFRRQATEYATHPTVDRELWHLQRVRHKLPIDKFTRTFGRVPPVSFAEAVRRTVSWLDVMGLTMRGHAA